MSLDQQLLEEFDLSHEGCDIRQILEGLENRFIVVEPYFAQALGRSLVEQEEVVLGRKIGRYRWIIGRD